MQVVVELHCNQANMHTEVGNILLEENRQGNETRRETGAHTRRTLNLQNSKHYCYDYAYRIQTVED